MKALFIGGTGIISTAVSQLAVERGWELTLLNRGTDNRWVPEGAEIVHADIRNYEEAERALRGRSFDIVADWVGFVPEHVEADIRLLAGRTAQFMYISSATVYQKPPSHFIVNETTPLLNPYSQYAQDKIACEDALNRAYRDSGFPITIIRPSHTYGLTMIPFSMNSWTKPYTLVDRLRKGKKVIVHGDGTSLWTITHNTDFAKGFVGLMGNRHAVGHAFNITSDEVLNWNQMLKTIADAAGAQAHVVHIASDFIVERQPSLAAPLLGDFSLSAVFDNSKIKSFVPGFAATTPFDKGIRMTLEYFDSHPEMQQVDNEYNAMLDRTIEAYLKK
jgi:nucleoside-diphosphate-sugar epimerase